MMAQMESIREQLRQLQEPFWQFRAALRQFGLK